MAVEDQRPGEGSVFVDLGGRAAIREVVVEVLDARGAASARLNDGPDRVR